MSSVWAKDAAVPWRGRHPETTVTVPVAVQEIESIPCLRKEPKTMTTIRTTAVLAYVLAALAIGPVFAGDIVGKVKYAGTAPSPAKIPITKDQAVCGKAEHFDESF